MPTYYIDSCHEVDRFTNKYGNPMVVYELEVKNQEGTWHAKVKQRPETPPPSGTINGTIKADGKGGNDFFKDKPTRENVTEYTSGKTPEQQKSIVRQHSQTVAVYYAALLQKAHPDIKPTYPWLKEIIDWFYEDAWTT